MFYPNHFVSGKRSPETNGSIRNYLIQGLNLSTFFLSFFYPRRILEYFVEGNSALFFYDQYKCTNKGDEKKRERTKYSRILILSLGKSFKLCRSNDKIFYYLV